MDVNEAEVEKLGILFSSTGGHVDLWGEQVRGAVMRPNMIVIESVRIVLDGSRFKAVSLHKLLHKISK